MYLPLYHPGTQQHINNCLILPRPISHGSLEGGTELIRTSLITKVSPESIDGFAFVFCYSNVKSYSIHIQGMMDAFVVRFKYCPSSRCLVELTEDELFSFPDKYPIYQNRRSDCLGRVIFDSIDDLTTKSSVYHGTKFSTRVREFLQGNQKKITRGFC
jgi:hypothetical protein